MRLERFPLALTFLLLTLHPASARYRDRYPLPGPGIPGSVGVNIHFNDPKPGEMEQLAAAGFRWIRQDFQWSGIERVRGEYDFAPYERLMAHLKQYGVRPIFILDYGNDLYQEGSPRTDESRAAFARFAAAAVTHFRGRGVVWEMWNEPNIGFWKPTPSVDEYIALALATGKAIRAAAPDEWFVGPGVSGMDFGFMERCFKAGLLRYWDAVSFHPYRNSPPETAAADFLRVRELIERYRPPDRSIPMISSEWGYSEKYPGLDLEKQSRYIVRQALSNVAAGLRISIWYDWHDDGVDPAEAEHHFGTVYNDYKPKPTYKAISTLTRLLVGSRYDGRLALGSPDDYCLLFSRGDTQLLAAWTTDPRPHGARLPASAGDFRAFDYLGAERPASSHSDGFLVTVTDAPQYFVSVGSNALLGLASRWRAPVMATISTPAEAADRLGHIIDGDWTAADRATVTGMEIAVRGEPRRDEFTTGSVLGGPLKPVYVHDFLNRAELPYDSDEPVIVRVTLGTTFGQYINRDLALISSRPLRVVSQPAAAGRLPVRVENPTGAAFAGRIRLSDRQGDAGMPLQFRKGETEQTVRLPVGVGPDGSYRAGVRVERRFARNAAGDAWTLVARSPTVEFRPLVSFAALPLGGPLPAGDYRVVPDGDPKVSSSIRAEVAPAPPGLANTSARAVRISYDFDKGWKFLRLEPERAGRAPLAGKPAAFGAWVFGDGSGDVLNARYTDASGQTFQPTAGRIDWRGWRCVSFSLRGDNSGHWGGADDGVIHYPIHLDTLLLVDSPGGRGGKGTLYATGFTLMQDVPAP
jgi:polysaccharide biosynthesis protein PslG